MQLSIHHYTPLPVGGPEARNGFRYQDHVAARFCLELLSEPELREVWCEVHDDIVLVWDVGNASHVEFVQVKSNFLDQLWSIALLCEREGKNNNAGTSIFERSLFRDQFIEPCRFRIITQIQAKAELRTLSLPFTAPARTAPHGADLKALCNSIEQKIGAVTSPNGNGIDYWVANTRWECCGSQDDVIANNRVALDILLGQKGTILSPDQKAELYQKLLQKADNAACASWSANPDNRKIRKLDLTNWLERAVSEALHPASAGSGTKLSEKLTAGGISEEAIRTALDQRRFYRTELLNPKYLSTDDRDLLIAEVQALLHSLLADLDSGVIAETGLQFHRRCIDQLNALRTNGFRVPPPASLLYGCMYDTTERCLHRFGKPAV